MAMTKKEREEMEALKKELRLAKALRWTEKIEPDVEPPSVNYMNDLDLAKGWLFNSYSGSIVKACSSSVSHNYGSDDGTTSKGARRLYSTKLRAMRALRNAVERECARKLAEIDRYIEEELKGDKSGNS